MTLETWCQQEFGVIYGLISVELSEPDSTDISV